MPPCLSCLRSLHWVTLYFDFQMRYLLLALIFVASEFPQPAFSQQDSAHAATVHRIVLNDGSEFVGTIQSQDSSQVGFLSLSRITMRIPREQIKTIERLSGTVVSGEFRQTDPNYTRLFFAPTGRALKSGQGYFSTYDIFFPFLAVGIGDVLTLAGGMSLIPGAESQIFYIAPKITPFHLKNVDLSAGLLYVNVTSGSASGVGIVYGIGTYGTSDGAVTAGLGWGFAEGELSNKPILLLGGEFRVARNIKFITENWIPPGTDLIVFSFGIRFFGESLAADLGFIRPSRFGSSGFPFIPWVGFAYNFGPK